METKERDGMDLSVRGRIEGHLVEVTYASASARQLNDLHAVKNLVTRFMCRQFLKEAL